MAKNKQCVKHLAQGFLIGLCPFVTCQNWSVCVMVCMCRVCCWVSPIIGPKITQCTFNNEVCADRCSQKVISNSESFFPFFFFEKGSRVRKSTTVWLTVSASIRPKRVDTFLLFRCDCVKCTVSQPVPNRGTWTSLSPGLVDYELVFSTNSETGNCSCGLSPTQKWKRQSVPPLLLSVHLSDTKWPIFLFAILML